MQIEPIKDSTLTPKRIKEKQKEIKEQLAPYPSYVYPKDVVVCAVTNLPLDKSNTLIYYKDKNTRKTVGGFFEVGQTKSSYMPRAVFFDGALYNSEVFHFVRAKDTDRMIPIEDAHQVDRGYYVEKVDKYEYLESHDLYAKKEDVVEACDTGERVSKRMAYRSEAGKYYRFSELSPDARVNRPLRFDHTKIEGSDERRVGVEFEFGNATAMTVEVLKNPEMRRTWASVRDGSLDGISNGIEFVSIPLELSELDIVKDAILMAEKMKCTADKACGFHVHVSATDLNFMDITSLVNLCSNLEDELFKMFPKDRDNNNYCKRLNENFKGFVDVTTRKDKKKTYDKLYDGQRATVKERHKLSKYVDSGGQRGIRYHWLNLDRLYHKREQPEQKTVEFRIHEATFDYERFVAFIYLCYYIVEFAKNHGKSVCKTVGFSDIISFAHYKHRKYIKAFLNSKVPEVKKKVKKKTSEHNNEARFEPAQPIQEEGHAEPQPIQFDVEGDGNIIVPDNIITEVAQQAFMSEEDLRRILRQNRRLQEQLIREANED